MMHYNPGMRTTLNIDEDVLERARAIAQFEDRSIGAVITDLLRNALERPGPAPAYRNGIRLLPDLGGPPVTLELVNRLRDETP